MKMLSLHIVKLRFFVHFALFVSTWASHSQCLGFIDDSNHYYRVRWTPTTKHPKLLVEDYGNPGRAQSPMGDLKPAGANSWNIVWYRDDQNRVKLSEDALVDDWGALSAGRIQVHVRHGWYVLEARLPLEQVGAAGNSDATSSPKEVDESLVGESPVSEVPEPDRPQKTQARTVSAWESIPVLEPTPGNSSDALTALTQLQLSGFDKCRKPDKSLTDWYSGLLEGRSTKPKAKSSSVRNKSSPSKKNDFSSVVEIVKNWF